MEKITVEAVETSNLDQRLVYRMKELLKNKQFFLITDLVNFLEDNMDDKWSVSQTHKIREIIVSGCIASGFTCTNSCPLISPKCGRFPEGTFTYRRRGFATPMRWCSRYFSSTSTRSFGKRSFSSVSAEYTQWPRNTSLMLSGSADDCTMLRYKSSYASFTSSSGSTVFAIASARFFVTVTALRVSNSRRRYGRITRLRLLLRMKSRPSVYA